MKDTFNSDFYVTAATVIPVLFLALTLQGSIFDAMVTHLDKNLRSKTAPAKGARRPLYDIVIYLTTIVMCIVFASVFGEVFAIYALYYQRSSAWDTYIILLSIIVLTLAVFAASFWRVGSAFYKMYEILKERDESRRKNESKSSDLQISKEE